MPHVQQEWDLCISNDCSRLVWLCVGYASCINQILSLTICLLSSINIFLCFFFFFILHLHRYYAHPQTKIQCQQQKSVHIKFLSLGFRCRHRRLIVFLCCMLLPFTLQTLLTLVSIDAKKISTYIDFLLPLVFVCICGAWQEFENWNPSTLVQSNIIPFVHCSMRRNFSSKIFMFRPLFLFASEISNMNSCHTHIWADFISFSSFFS